MSDDDWGDDAGGDDGWGDGGDEGDGGGDDGWGDENCCDAHDAEAWECPCPCCAAGPDPDGDELSLADKIANEFYKMEDELDSEEKFKGCQEVVKLGKDVDHDDNSLSETHLFIFKALAHCVVLNFRLNKNSALEEMLDNCRDFVQLIPKMARSDTDSALDSLLDGISSPEGDDMSDAKESDAKENDDVVCKVYECLLKELVVMPDSVNILYFLEMRRANYFEKKQKYDVASEYVQNAHKLCCNPDGSDDEKKGSKLLEIYAFKMKLSVQSGDKLGIKTLYEVTKNLVADVAEPRIMSIIKECWGRMFAAEENWTRANTEFMTAFEYFQEAGYTAQAKTALKYVVITGMLAKLMDNPFSDTTIQAFAPSHPDITPYSDLRTSYEVSNIALFNSSIRRINGQTTDPFIKSHLERVATTFQAKSIIKVVQSFQTIRISHLANMLEMDAGRVERVLVQLILDSALFGRIDQISGILHMEKRGAQGVGKYLAIEQWNRSLRNVTTNMAQPTGRVY